MYNPDNLHQCEEEKKKRPSNFIDSAMTGVGVVASLSGVPQVLKIWKTGDVSGISIITYIIALGAVAAWFLYGLHIKNRPLIITSFLSTIILSIVVLQIFANGIF